MATLVLTAVGTAIGGPIGGAIGAIIGQQVDQNLLFAPPDRQGPRLQELAVQTSSYGTQIPKIFGKMRVAGSVIWATDLVENSSTQGGGKGRPDTTTYSYFANLAVALSSRPIQDIGRIWADGNLLRGSAGDFKTDTDFRFYTGNHDQPLDPLIAATAGANEAPAHRGFAYAMFENFDLTPYGNRIPSLTFEVIADADAVRFDDLGSACADVIESTGDMPNISGFAVQGRSVAEALEPASNLLSLGLMSVGDHLRFYRRDLGGEAELSITNDAPAIESNGESLAPPAMSATAPSAVPGQLAIRHYDPDRDFQAGRQNAFRPGWGRDDLLIDFPASLSASGARELAEAHLRQLYRERDRLDIHLTANAHDLRPGDLLEFADPNGKSGLWRIRNWELLGDALALRLSSHSSAMMAAVSETESGTHVAQPDGLSGITKLRLIDLPFDLENPSVAAGQPQLFVAATGTGDDWRFANLFLSDESGGLDFLGRSAGPAAMGVADSVIGSASSLLFDKRNSVEITLIGPNGTLSPANEVALHRGANFAKLGDEFLQFAAAEAIGPNRFRLSDFRRGLADTESAIGEHQPDEHFTLLDLSALRRIDLSRLAPFAPLEIAAVGRGDGDPVHESLPSIGIAMRPWTPVHVRADLHETGDMEIFWVRRPRIASDWLDGVELPLVEEQEAYRVTVSDQSNGGLLAVRETDGPGLLIDASDLLVFRSAGATHLLLAVQQIGQFQLSLPVQVIAAI